MENGSKKLAILAGSGNLPVLLAKSAKEQGFTTYGIAVTEQAKHNLKDCCEKSIASSPGQVAKILKFAKDEMIDKIVFSGKFSKLDFLRNMHTFDWQALKYMARMVNFNDDTFHAVMEEFSEKYNIEILPQTQFLKHLYQEKEILSKREPTVEERVDIEYGMRIAKELATLDVGQTVVVKNKMVVALEGIEGTDETIKRGCALAKSKVVVAKAARRNQDQRFDIPTIGEKTIEAIGKNGGVLVFESGEVLVANKEDTIAAANKYDIALLAV